MNADGTVTFRPLWTAMVLLDALWPQGAQPASVTGQPEGLTAFAARRPGGSLAVLAVNSDLTHSKRLVLRTAARTAQLGRLTPRGAYAVALNGRTLGWADGRPRWSGRTRLTSLRADGGRVRTTLAPGTAAWLVLDPAKTPGGPAALTR